MPGDPASTPGGPETTLPGDVKLGWGQSSHSAGVYLVRQRYQTE